MEQEPAVSSNGEPVAAPKPNKRTLVVEALSLGITMPRKVSEWMLATHGVEITPAHVSTLKGNLKNESAGKPRGKPGRKPRSKTDPAVTPLEPSPEPPKSSRLSLADLDTLVDLARKVGGVAKLHSFLDSVKRVR